MTRFAVLRFCSAITATMLCVVAAAPADAQPDGGDDSATSTEASDDPSGDPGKPDGGRPADGTTDESTSPSDDSEDGTDKTQADRKDGEGTDDRDPRNDQRKWSIRGLVERARTNSDLVDEFEAKREQAEWKKFQAKWARGPKINSTTAIAPVPANADPDRFGENLSEISALNIGPLIREDINLVVPIYTFGRIGTLKRLADVGIDVADLKEREAKLNAIFQTKRAYYSLQLSRTFEELLQDGDEKIEQQLQKMEDARDFGKADFETKDFRKLQIFATEVDERIADNRKLENVATDGLTYLAELDADSPRVGTIDEDSDPEPLEPESVYLEAAKHHRPEMRQLEKAMRARELQVNLEKQKFLPNLGLALGFGFSWSTEETARQPVCFRGDEEGDCEDVDGLFARPDHDPLDRLSLQVGLVLRWNLDPLVQRGKLGERRAQVRALEAQKRRAEGAIELDVRKKYADAAGALEKIKIRKRRLDAARRWRDQLGLSMQSADTDLEDFDEEAIKPLKAFYEAKAKYLEARYNYFVARAALAQAIGVDYLSQVGADSSVDGTVAIDETTENDDQTDSESESE